MLFPLKFQVYSPVCFLSEAQHHQCQPCVFSLCVSSETGSCCCCWRPSPESAPLCLMISPLRSEKKKKNTQASVSASSKADHCVISLYELSESVRVFKDLRFVYMLVYICFILRIFWPSVTINGEICRPLMDVEGITSLCKRVLTSCCKLFIYLF